ncbi:DEAD/DEAH box helicase [Pseudoalteromonas sp. P1-25]|uniref:DEAD/DEAH box helicase n=1 Tax=Pseudoalteromonas sp. P1-25 TaxID=1723758 RepID=UPI0006D6870B|nr:DEAD/DEAH box helicase [Pseudoalteromonas sp. P1-25]KPZ57962.1 ski2-like helicase [Pseudoalteromonas sp. P1-25]
MVEGNNPKQLTLLRLLNTSFNELYNSLLLNEQIEPSDYLKLLSIAIVLTNQDEVSLKRLAYRIVLKYSLNTGDYIPLYDFSLNNGLIPVARMIGQLIDNPTTIARSSFVNEFSLSFIDSFETNGLYRTEQQYALGDFVKVNKNESLYVVAPTSYGKSDLIINEISNANTKTCILVPSKSLLAQTKKRIFDTDIEGVDFIVTHPEMYEENPNAKVFLLTQERLSRLLSQYRDLAFDTVFVDEAHNLLNKDSRSRLLASVITILQFRNSNTAVKYLTPFINEIENIKLKFTPPSNLKFSIDEYVKSEFYFIADFRCEKKELSFYDQFTNSFIENNANAKDHFEYLFQKSVNKNIIYFNKPTSIESFVKEMIRSLPIIQNEQINSAIDELSEGFAPEYLIVEGLKRGVVYHHGSMTEPVRNYVEHLFRECAELKYLVSSSTLLEGINMPIERLFLMCTKKGIGNLTAAHFKNLVGRVNRFSEIFNESDYNNIKKLTPEIHIIGTDKYSAANANFQKFLKNRVNVRKELKDKPENVLLEAVDIVDGNKKEYTDAITRLENLEKGVVNDYQYQYTKTEVGNLLIANSVSEIEVFDKELEIHQTIENIEDESITNTNQLMDVVYNCFVCFIEETEVDSPLPRLENQEAKTFYAMLLDWKIDKKPFKLMIRLFMNYWDDLIQRIPNFQIYVGKWGDEVKRSGGHKTHYTQIGGKTRAEKINLAIVRIKEEEDFLEHELLKFIEILNDLNKINSSFYKKVKYGTTDDETIKLIKIGLSRGVAELLLVKYPQFVLDIPNSHSKRISYLVIDEMKRQEEGLLQQLEVKMNVTRG